MDYEDTENLEIIDLTTGFNGFKDDYLYCIRYGNIKMRSYSFTFSDNFCISWQ